MISIKGLNKTFENGTKAVQNLDLEVREGEILALLGPNGAGKTTTIRILTTLAGFDDGTVRVADFNVDVSPNEVRKVIGYVAQETAVDYFLTGRENMRLQAHLYKMKSADIDARVEELAQYFDLGDHLDELVSSYSGGMRRKLDIAMALIHQPRVLFLDEPTLGLDTKSRRNLWALIEKLNNELKLTILLTTHYLEEADALSDRVAIIDEGQIKIIDTPSTLKDNIHGDSVTLEVADEFRRDDKLESMIKESEFIQNHTWDNSKLHLYVENGAAAIPKIIEYTNAANITVLNVRYARPTLDDVFIRYTGSSMLNKKEEAVEEWWEKWAGKGGSSKWQKKWQQAEKGASDEGEQPSNESEEANWQQEASKWSPEEQRAWWDEQEKDNAAKPDDAKSDDQNKENWQQNAEQWQSKNKW
jgi:ABC-2 type transport system ATP-binding protein